MKAWLFRLVNRLGNALPKRLQRAVSDFPGVLWLLERWSRATDAVLTSPEGLNIVINPLLHSFLTQHHSLQEYEPDVRAALNRLTRPGMAAYDVGANVGVFSLLLSSLVGDEGVVYAFEPEANNYGCLRRSIRLNGVDNVVVDTRAVGARSGVESFDRRGGAFSGRLTTTDGSYHRSANIVDVTVISLDDLVQREARRSPDIVKIDVEGNEGIVLGGMRDTLEAYSPIIVCELHTHLGESSDLVWNILSEHGYTLFSIADVVARGIGREAAIDGLTGVRHFVAAKL